MDVRGDCARFRLAGVRQQDGELLAADAGNEIPAAYRAADRAGEGLQRRIADEMAPEGVVAAEIVEIDDQECERTALRHSRLPLLVERRAANRADSRDPVSGSK